MEYYLLLFSYLRSGKKTKRGVRYRHSTRNASKIDRKSGTPTLLYTVILYTKYSEGDEKKNIRLNKMP